MADRAVFLTLEPIPEDRRRPEQELWAAFEAERPRILGVLLDAEAKGLLGFTKQVQHLLRCCCDGTMLWPAQLEERIEIYRLHAGGKSRKLIAASLGRSPSTISRELRRNAKPSKLVRRRQAGPGSAIGRAAAALGLPLQAGAPDRPAKPREEKPCDGTFSRADRRPSGAGARSRHYQPRVNLPFHLSPLGSKGLLAPLAALPQTQTGTPQTPRRQSRQLHQTSPSERAAEAEGRTTPGHWEADFMLFAR